MGGANFILLHHWSHTCKAQRHCLWLAHDKLWISIKSISTWQCTVHALWCCSATTAYIASYLAFLVAIICHMPSKLQLRVQSTCRCNVKVATSKLSDIKCTCIYIKLIMHMCKSCTVCVIIIILLRSRTTVMAPWCLISGTIICHGSHLSTGNSYYTLPQTQKGKIHQSCISCKTWPPVTMECIPQGLSIP